MSMNDDWESMKQGEWTLWRLDSQKNGEERWSIGKFGPRMYLTASEHTAIVVLNALAAYDSGKDL